MLAPEDAWRVLRGSRSRPPGLAKDSGARRTTFQAALAQSEELWTAARSVGPSVSPILLFYSLNQAGYALLAALQPGDWGSAGSHGLKAAHTSGGASGRVSMSDFTVTATGQGTVQRLSGLLRSTLPSAPVSMASLVCSLPQTEHLFRRQGALRPLLVEVGHPHDHRSTNRCLAISYLPPSLVEWREQGGFSSLVNPTSRDIASWLSGYPTVASLGEPVAVRQGVPPDIHRMEVDVPVILEWRHEQGLPETVTYDEHPRLDLDHYAWVRRHIDVPLDWTSKEAQGWLLPSLAPMEPSPKPLITWWLLLFAASIAARYHPSQWTRMLRVDSSEDAVAVEEVLKLAAEQMPSLLLQVVHSQG